ncbi:3'(2'),5'-bisphosphate nucleotidase CysQ [Candidatus Obscuribacterales bacterium]|nr:3'(2'),5'-bisphosphate nucleotidase CysQ [Candidatus Obscuribacterales bacterium]
MSLIGNKVKPAGAPIFAIEKIGVSFDPMKVVAIALEAGDAVMEIYKTDFAVQHKEDASPLTEADLAANRIIKAGLAHLTPSIPILSEESLVEWEERKSWEYLWCVDPVDGTKEFVNRTDEFTINIALVENNRPILGVVHAPALKVTYFASREQGAFKIQDSGEPQQIKANPIPVDGPIKVVGSRSHQSPAMVDYMNKLQETRSQIDFVKSGSALKFCLVADGTADMYPRLAPTSEWDTAAGHIVINESGKRVIQYGKDEELVYNKQDLLNPWFICE